MKSKGFFYLSAFIALVMLISLACSLFSSTPTAAPTSNPPTQSQPQSQPSEPAVPAVTETSTAQDFFTEEFEGSIDNWSYFVTKNKSNADESNVAPTADGGYLKFDLKKNLNVYALYDPYTYDNVRIDIRAENRGTNNNNINMICRYSDAGWYEISIANNGLYWLYAFDGSKGTYAKLADGGSNKIKSGKEVNDYTFICNEHNLVLYINNFETRTYTDNQYAFRDGQVGIGASSFNDVPVAVDFDWVKISQP